jgi:hypothetical protein
MQAQINYRTRTLTFQYAGTVTEERLSHSHTGSNKKQSGEPIGKLKLPKRAETIVRLPTEVGLTATEGLVEKKELIPGVNIAESLVRISVGHVITIILNSKEEEIELTEPAVTVTELARDNPVVIGAVDTVRENKDRYKKVLEKLRVDHLNPDEKESLREICFDYQDVFYLPGDRLSHTNAVKHSINLEPGTTPINTRPESQKQEVDRQVTKLLEEGIDYSGKRFPLE